MALKVKDKMEPMSMMSGELWKPCRQKQLKKGEGKRPKLAVVREQRGGRRRGQRGCWSSRINHMRYFVLQINKS